MSLDSGVALCATYVSSTLTNLSGGLALHPEFSPRLLSPTLTVPLDNIETYRGQRRTNVVS